MEIVRIAIVDDVLEKKFWKYVPKRYVLSNHINHRSQYSTDTDCGNCDGGGCDNCRVLLPAYFQFVIDNDELYNILVAKEGLSPSLAKKLSISKEAVEGDVHYYVKLPSNFDLKKFQEFYNILKEEYEE